MTPWKQELERKLAEPGAPAALPFTALARAAYIARGKPIPDPTLHAWLTDAIARRRLESVIRGLYLNRFTSPGGRLADAVPFLRRDAIVSLHTALDEAGLYNNPPSGVTAIVPLDPGPTRPRTGRVDTKQGPVFVRAMPRRLLEAGEPDDRIDHARSVAHPQATPEKALLDWLYLATSPRSNLAPPAPHDVDISQLDRRRLNRLAKQMGLEGALHRWLDGNLLTRSSAT